MTMYRLDEWAAALDPTLTAADLVAARAGFALMCLAPVAPSFRELAERSLALAAQGRSEVLFDRFGRVAAYVSFAYLDAQAERQLLRQGVTAAVATAACSGERLWILDFAAFDGGVRAVLGTLQARLFEQALYAGYFRYKHGRRIGKMVSRAELRAHCPAATVALTAAQAQAAFPNYAHGSHASLRQAILLGRCMALACAGGQFDGLTALQAKQRLWTPLSLNQYRIHHDAQHVPTGLVTWALLDGAALARRDAEPLHELAPEAWNAGTVRCVGDILGSAAHAQALAAEHPGLLRYDVAASAGVAA